MKKLLFIFLPSILYFLSSVNSVSASDFLYFFHTDHLGSTVLVTDQNGNKVSEQRYLPYGQQLTTDNSPLTTRLYTGQEKDAETGLYYYNARYYNPATGRFISADKAQGPNRYAYVGGNPLRFSDPTGHAAAADAGIGGGSFVFPIEKRPWFIREFLIPEVKELYGVTLRTASNPSPLPPEWEFNPRPGRSWSAEEIFALEDLFKKVSPSLYREAVIKHYYFGGDSGVMGFYEGNKTMFVVSSIERLLKHTDTKDPGVIRVTTEGIVLHELGHRITTKARLQFIKAAEQEGLKWIGTEAIGSFPTEYSKTNPNEAFSEFLLLYHLSPSFVEESYPEIYNLFNVQMYQEESYPVWGTP